MCCQPAKRPPAAPSHFIKFRYLYMQINSFIGRYSIHRVLQGHIEDQPPPVTCSRIAAQAMLISCKMGPTMHHMPPSLAQETSQDHIHQVCVCAQIHKHGRYLPTQASCQLTESSLPRNRKGSTGTVYGRWAPASLGAAQGLKRTSLVSMGKAEAEAEAEAAPALLAPPALMSPTCLAGMATVPSACMGCSLPNTSLGKLSMPLQPDLCCGQWERWSRCVQLVEVASLANYTMHVHVWAAG